MIQAITLLTTDEAALICDALDRERVHTDNSCRAIRCEKLIARIATNHDLDSCDLCQTYGPDSKRIRIDEHFYACPECAAKRERGWTPNG